MKFENGDVAVKSTTAARQGVTGHNVRYVLAISLLGVIAAFVAVAIVMGGKLPV